MTRSLGSPGGFDYVQTSTPPDESDGTRWLDPSGDQPTLYVYDDSLGDWFAVTPTYADSAPSSPNAGEVWIDTSDSTRPMYVYSGSAWEDVGANDDALALDLLGGI